MTAFGSATKRPAKAYLQGGPCDGKTVTLTQASWIDGFIECQGAEYLISSPIKYHDGAVIFNLFMVTGSGPPPPKLKAPQALGGWKDLQRSVNHKMPATLQASARTRAAALRQLHRAGKVLR